MLTSVLAVHGKTCHKSISVSLIGKANGLRIVYCLVDEVIRIIIIKPGVNFNVFNKFGLGPLAFSDSEFGF
jgi:hypothetical protein